VDWRVMGPHHIPQDEIEALFRPTFSLEDVAEAATYWNDAPWIYRPLSGPYRPMVYRFSRRR